MTAVQVWTSTSSPREWTGFRSPEEVPPGVEELPSGVEELPWNFASTFAFPVYMTLIVSVIYH
jgi:hypothetical protein